MAEKYSEWLYQLVKGKKDYSQEEYKEICECCILFEDTMKFLSSEIPCREGFFDYKYIIILFGDVDDKMICSIRILDEDLLSATVLMSVNAMKYLCEKKMYSSVVLSDDSLVEM